MKTRNFTILVLLMLACAAHVAAQSGRHTYRKDVTTDDTDKVYVEEIKLNVSALGEKGTFRAGVGTADLLVLEDGVIHQPASVRRTPANVLIMLDTGGEDRHAKDFKTTVEAAKALIAKLSPEDSVALLEVNDEARFIMEWTSDKELLDAALDKHMRFGRRSDFTEGLKLARLAFARWDSENRHLVLISDGLGLPETESERERVMRSLLETDVNVHVVSYTKMEKAVTAARRRSVSAGSRRADIPAGGGVPVQGSTPTGTLGTINLDRAMVRKIDERAAALDRSEKSLERLASATNGEMINPSSREEMVEKMEYLSRTIDSNYVVTYVPKRALSDARDGEERNIEVTSRRYDVLVQARRKLIVRKPEGRQ